MSPVSRMRNGGTAGCRPVSVITPESLHLPVVLSAYIRWPGSVWGNIFIIDRVTHHGLPVLPLHTPKVARRLSVWIKKPVLIQIGFLRIPNPLDRDPTTPVRPPRRKPLRLPPPRPGVSSLLHYVMICSLRTSLPSWSAERPFLCSYNSI